ncbi:MAG: ATP synthase F1 subunit gamma [Patescibacteria group bacterium]
MNTKDIQRRIKSINSTKKITKAMEMVAATKMRRAIEAVLRTRTYANLSWETILSLSESLGNNGGVMHPLLTRSNEVGRTAVILITSNRGLCGGFNSNIMKKAHDSIEMHEKKNGRGVDLLIVGDKGKDMHKYYGYNIEAIFPKADIAYEINDILPISQMVLEGFRNRKYDKVMVAYTDFISASSQVPRVKQLLPVDLESQDEYLGIMGKDTRVGADKEFIEQKREKHLQAKQAPEEFMFEPDPYQVLDEMIPRLIEVQLFQALLESNASEHSARMASMHQANDAADDMVSELTLSYNKARQATITSEISEISAGANALQEE